MKKELSRNNHYLSQMYLDAWKNDNNEVFVYELLVPHENCPMWKSKSTKSVGSYNSMFVRLKDGIEVDDIEKWFRDRYENPAKKSLEHAINGEKITVDEWHCLIDFVACHIVRSPAFFIKTLEYGKKCEPIFQKTADEVSNMKEEDFIKIQDYSNYSNDKDELFPFKMTNIGEKDNNVIFKVETIIGKQFYLWNIKNLLEDTSKILHSHKWGIITVDDKVVLPTSDDPVICLNYNNESDYNFNGGWGRKNCNILFPISPNKILYTQIGTKINPRWKVDYKTSLLFKKMIIEHSYRRVISNFDDQDVAIIKPRYVNKSEHKREKKMWEDLQKEYLEKEIDYIR